MGVDKRGVTRGKCTECECEEIESLTAALFVSTVVTHPSNTRNSEVLSPSTKKRFVPVSNNYITAFL